MSTVVERIQELQKEAEEIENHPDFLNGTNNKLIAKYYLIKTKLKAFNVEEEL